MGLLCYPARLWVSLWLFLPHDQDCSRHLSEAHIAGWLAVWPPPSCVWQLLPGSEAQDPEQVLWD
jgi:hypothetical protein